MPRRCEPCADPDGCTEAAVRGSYCAAHAARYLVKPPPLKGVTRWADRFSYGRPEDHIPAADMDGLRAEIKRRAAQPRA